jgi:alginate O-acetyltransferase complex protein AlgI
MLIPVFIGIISIIWILTLFFPKLKLTISTNINLMMTMLLGGLWHGSSWMFIIWGGLNGLGLVFYKFWRKVSPYENSTLWLTNLWKIFITFNFITFTRIWFRSESMQGVREFSSQVLTKFGWMEFPEMLNSYWKVIIVILIGLVLHWLPESVKKIYRNWFIARPIYQKILISVTIVFVIYQSLSAGLQPFIYFRF